MVWMVTGGAGYIGQHVVRAFLARGHEVMVLDDLSSGNAGLLPDGVELVRASVTDEDAVAQALGSRAVTGVVHLAGLKAADESVERPLDYYHVNTTGTVSLLRAMGRREVSTLLFSSSAAVYGDSATGVVTEDSQTRPLTPYGSSKLMGELVIKDAAAASALSWVALRYFNVAGTGQPDLVDRGERNLVPRALRAVQRGDRPVVYGQDYPTPDGTCVRDYIHVADLADAHLVAAERAAAVAARPGAAPLGEVYNVGCGVGASVLDVLACAAEVTGRSLDPERAGRRAGDPAMVVADVGKIRRELGWSAALGLSDMVASTWEAMVRH